MGNKKITKQMTVPEDSSGEVIISSPEDTPESAPASVAKTQQAEKSKSASGQASTKKTVTKQPATKVVKATPVAKDSEPVAKKASIKKPAKESPAVVTEEHDAKPKKEKLVRDSFTMPESEYQALADVKKECLKAGIAIKKSELLRVSLAGLKLLSVTQIIAARDGLTKIQTGRPKK